MLWALKAIAVSWSLCLCSNLYKHQNVWEIYVIYKSWAAYKYNLTKIKLYYISWTHIRQWLDQIPVCSSKQKPGLFHKHLLHSVFDKSEHARLRRLMGLHHMDLHIAHINLACFSFLLGFHGMHWLSHTTKYSLSFPTFTVHQTNKESVKGSNKIHFCLLFLPPLQACQV